MAKGDGTGVAAGAGVGVARGALDAGDCEPPASGFADAPAGFAEPAGTVVSVVPIVGAVTPAGEGLTVGGCVRERMSVLRTSALTCRPTQPDTTLRRRDGMSSRKDPPIDFGAVDEEFRGAIRESFLAHLPEDAVAALVEGAVRFEVPAGPMGHLRGPGQVAYAAVRLVSAGLLRVVRAVPDGRTITQRYLRRGEVAGIAGAFIPPTTPNTGRSDALMRSVYYQFRAELWRQTAERDARVAVALLAELSRIAELSMEHMANRALASMRQRVVGQLLDAAHYADGSDPIVPVTQQQLADGVGSAREVVARVLHSLREEHLVATKVGSVVLLDAERLRSELNVP